MFQFHLQVFSWVNDNNFPEENWKIFLTYASIATSFVQLLHGIASYNLFQIYQHEPGFRSAVTYVLFNMYFQSSVFLLPLVKLLFTTMTTQLFDSAFHSHRFNTTGNATSATKNPNVPKSIFMLNCGMYLLLFFFTATLTHACIINKCKCNYRNLSIKKRIKSFIHCFEGHMIVNPLNLVFRKWKGCGHNRKDVQHMRKMYSQVILMYASCTIMYSGMGILISKFKSPHSDCLENNADGICKMLGDRHHRYNIFFCITLPLGALAFLLALIEYLTIVCCDLLIMKYAFDLKHGGEGHCHLSEQNHSDIALEIRNGLNNVNIAKDNVIEASTALVNSQTAFNNEQINELMDKNNYEEIQEDIAL